MSITQQELESRLWAAANSLRGPVDPANFKEFIFPLLFLKRIDEVARPVRGTGWPSDRRVQRKIRLAPKEATLPVTGELFDRTYAYMRENY